MEMSESHNQNGKRELKLSIRINRSEVLTQNRRRKEMFYLFELATEATELSANSHELTTINKMVSLRVSKLFSQR